MGLEQGRVLDKSRAEIVGLVTESGLNVRGKGVRLRQIGREVAAFCADAAGYDLVERILLAREDQSRMIHLVLLVHQDVPTLEERVNMSVKLDQQSQALFDRERRLWRSFGEPVVYTRRTQMSLFGEMEDANVLSIIEPGSTYLGSVRFQSKFR